MSDNKKELNDILHALKVAFCYMPKAIEVNRYDHGDKVDEILADIAVVREMLMVQGVDPEEVEGEIHPANTPNSCY
jgi:hypothetical protein